MTQRFQEIIDAYEASFRTHGDSPAALLGAKGRQHLRFQALDPLIRSGEVKTLLDYGCGLAHLLPYLRSMNWDGQYSGADIVESFIRYAQSHAIGNAHFEHLQPDGHVSGNYDVVFASGVFSLQTHDSMEESRRYALTTISQLFGVAKHFLVCDFMTDYVDFRQPHALHWLPQQLIDFTVMHLTRRFVIRHDLMPYEFSMVFYKDADVRRPVNVYQSGACI